jgi:acetoin utilization deacetylase AcuC-like enzyme
VIDAFRPNYLVVSAGFDLVQGDPVATNGGFHVSLDGLEQIGQRLVGLGLPTVIVQEGGYQIDRLGEMAVRFLRAFT